jgi:hypothetical protein
MQDPSFKRREDRSGFIFRVDRAARDVNAFLFVLAVGLAALDLSCYWAIKLRDSLPPAHPAMATAVAPLGFGSGFAAMQPDRPQARVRGGATAQAP